MRIAVCDDEKHQIELLTKYIKNWAEKNETQIEIHTFNSANEFLFFWPEGKRFDLLFLDIKMKGMSGVELAREIRKTDDKLIIVFSTGLIDYVFQGYEVSALQYLLKPVKENDFCECLDRACKIIDLRKSETLLIPLEGKSIRLFYNEIYTFEIFSHYIEVKWKKGTLTFKKKMDELEQELPKDWFFRCHRSFIVNMQYVNTVNRTDVLMDNGTHVPVSKSRWNAMNEAFLRYYCKGMMV